MFDESTTPDALLHAFIDDELAPEFEEQFYADLSADADLRTRLRQMRAIRGEAKRFRTAAAPPHDLSNAVFSRLGFATQAANRPVRTLGAAILMHRVWSPLASAAAAAIITATLIFSLLDSPAGLDNSALAIGPSAAPGTDLPGTTTGGTRGIQDEKLRNTDNAEGSAQTSSSAQTSLSAQTQPADPASIASSAGFSGTDSQHSADHRPDSEVASMTDRTALSMTDRNTSSMTEPGSDDAANAFPQASGGTPAFQRRPALAQASAQQPDALGKRHGEAVDGSMASESEANDAFPSVAYVETPDFWAASQAEGNVHGDGAYDAMQTGNGLPQTGSGLPRTGDQVVDTRQYFPLLRGTPLLRFVTVELRGINATSFPETDMATRSNPWMQNMAVAVFYSHERDDYGLEFGQEAFAQHYTGIEYGKSVAYEQNLLTSWMLAGYRHRFQPLFGSVEPYVSIGAGATIQAWPLARAGAGFMYMPDRRVRFHLGLEGALLAYPYQEQWFSTERVGLSYGISLLF